MINPCLRLRLYKKEGHWRQKFILQPVQLKEEKIKGPLRSFRTRYTNLLINEECSIPRDLRKECPITATVFKSKEECLLLLCVDHLAIDAIGFDLLEKNLIEVYKQIIDGYSIFPNCNNLILEFLNKQEENKTNETSNLLFWKHHLKAWTPDSLVQSKAVMVPGTTLNYILETDILKRLNDFCKHNGCFLFNIVIAINLLLLKDAGEGEEITLGIPISNRSNADEQSIMGCLFVPLFIHFRIIESEPLLDLIIRIRNVMLDVLPHRQFDHTSLLTHLHEEAIRQGRSTFALLKDCNFLTDKNEVLYPNSLFVDRLDNKPNIGNFISPGLFSVTGIQRTSILTLKIMWDMEKWPISIDKASNVINKCIQEIESQTINSITTTT